MFDELRKILAKQFRIPEESITAQSDIKADLHADSISLIQLLMTVEEDYGITIPDEVLMNFKTVGDIAEYLDKTK